MLKFLGLSGLAAMLFAFATLPSAAQTAKATLKGNDGKDAGGVELS